jgi:AcrR family transcriptional regulator
MSGLALRLQVLCEDLSGPHARSARKTADKDWKLKGVKYLGDMAGRRVVPTEAGDQTKERILSAAEQLFAKSGFDGVSMRDIGRAAEVPFALITYHFQSKLGLYQALFRRRQDLLTTQRLQRLHEVQITGDREADIRQIAAAIVDPLINIRSLPGGLDFTRLIAREICDPMESERGIVAEYLDPVAFAALELLERVAPHVDYEQICWAFYFASGSLAINNANTGRVERLSSGKCQTSDTSHVATMLTTFIAAAWDGMLSTNIGQQKRSPARARRSPQQRKKLV